MPRELAFAAAHVQHREPSLGDEPPRHGGVDVLGAMPVSDPAREPEALRLVVVVDRHGARLWLARHRFSLRAAAPSGHPRILGLSEP